MLWRHIELNAGGYAFELRHQCRWLSDLPIRVIGHSSHMNWNNEMARFCGRRLQMAWWKWIAQLGSHTPCPTSLSRTTIPPIPILSRTLQSYMHWKLKPVWAKCRTCVIWIKPTAFDLTNQLFCSDMHKELCQGISGLCDAMKPTNGADLLKFLRKVNFTGKCRKRI